MKFARETMEEVVGEIQPLLLKHWQEIAHYQDIALDPDYGRYAAMERSGVLRIFTARDSGTLVGYGIFCVAPGLHYRQSKQAVCDILFVDPEHRRGLGVASALLRHCESALNLEEVQVVYHRTKAAHDFGNLLERLGYELVDRTFARRLDRGRNADIGR